MSKNVFNKPIIQQASSDQPSSPSHPRITITSTPDSSRRAASAHLLSDRVWSGHQPALWSACVQ